MVQKQRKYFLYNIFSIMDNQHSKLYNRSSNNCNIKWNIRISFRNIWSIWIGEKMKDILIMGIESSCDETSVAIVKNGREVLSNIIDTQISIHEKFGGVVPEIASRNHVEAISNVTKKQLKKQG